MSWFVKRNIIQTAGMLAFYSLIFISAGTIHFWQGWLFCLTFTASALAIGIYLIKYDRALLERRMRFGPLQEPRLIERVLITCVFVAFIALMIIAGLDHRFEWSHLPTTLVAIANLTMAAGFGLTLVVLRANSYAASTITVEAGQRVISTGPYSYVRHPMYSGAFLLTISMPIALGSWWGLIPVAVAMPALIARIFDEESALRSELPGYSEYCRAVPYRLLPHLW